VCVLSAPFCCQEAGVNARSFAVFRRTTQIRRSSVVRWVYGRASRSLTDERDIAAVAVHTLNGDHHRGARYVLSGPEALTQIQQVEAIGDALGRTLRREEIAPAQLKDQLDGVPDSALETWANFVQTREIVTTTMHDLTGKTGRPFAEWAHDHADDSR
jgi:uncharacterized protein YbjT (DUF2867 family)